MRKIVLAAASLFCTTLAFAQSATDAVIKDRMERAKRDASNPLRIIIEASQVKRTRAAETPTAAPATAPAPVAARPAAESRPAAERRPARTPEQAPPAAEPANRALAQQAKPSSAAADAAGPASSAAPAPAADAAVVNAASAAAPAPAAASLGAVPAAAGLAAAAAPGASAAPNAAQPAAEVLTPLKLVHYIEPEIPARIRARLRPTNEVTVGFKVQPDGSVSDIGIRATTSRALDPVVLAAVKQWRYDPVPEPREHTVQLVFNLTE